MILEGTFMLWAAVVTMAASGAHGNAVPGTAGVSFGSWKQTISLLGRFICFIAITLCRLLPGLTVEVEIAKIN